MVVAVVVVEGVVGVGLVDDGGVGGERGLDVEDVGQGLPLDADGGRGLARLGVGLGDDGGDGLAAVGDLLLGQQGLVVAAELEERQQGVEVHRHVGAGQDADDAFHPLGRGSVDAADAGVVVRAADAAEVEQAVEGVVVVVGRAAGDVAEDVLPADALADHLEVVVALVGEEVLAELDTHGRGPRQVGCPRWTLLATVLI